MSHRSHFKIMGFTLEFCVRSIYPKLFVRFSLNITPMFLSVSWCAEPMTRLCRLKVKVMGFTVEFGVPSISPKPFEQFSFNFTQMLISVMMIRSNDSARQIQSHNFRSWNLPLNFVSAPYLLNPLNDLH